MLVKNPKKGVLTDYRIASLLGLLKPHPKTNEFVNVGIDGKCHVYQRLSKTLDMPVRRYSPTTSWTDAGPAFEKFGHLLTSTPDIAVDDLYKLTEAIRHITLLKAKDITNPILVDLLFGKDWESNKELF